MGDLLVLSCGTVAENNRFKARALNGGFLDEDLMDKVTPTAGLVAADKKMRTVKAYGASLLSHYRLVNKSWNGKLASGKRYRDAYQAWMNKVLKKPAQCLYLTGHHWSSSSRAYLSWEDTTSYFHVRIDADKQEMHIGPSASRRKIDTSTLRTDCRLVVGAGCNAATAKASLLYQKFFSGGKKPIVLGWSDNISLPRRRHRARQQINKRFFDYLETWIKDNGGIPASDRLEWFYDKQPMELVRAWGHAVAYWHRKTARARSKSGAFYKFKLKRSAKTAVPVKI